jgi:ubiquitin C-terminal hydrolase
MNATLQCFCHIEKFVNFFKYSQQVITIVKNDKSNLTSSFKLLIEKLWPNNYDESYPQKFYSPEEFKNKISKLNPLFQGIAANDAKDLVNFIIMTLHKELNKAKKGSDACNIILDQSNPQIMFQNFANNFIKENQSIISDLFYGINCNNTQCCHCNRNIYNYQIYFFLVFPLEEVRKFKNNNQMNFINQPVNIYDCFDYDRKINCMFGENSMYCNYCKQNTNCQMCTCLTTGPEILILLLNRGKGIEFDVKIIFPEDLNLYNYIEYKNTGCIYKLIGVITHIGESGMGGHFIAYCKDPISLSWYKYNDAIVSEVQDFQKEVINFAMPYLLFYQKNQ